MGFCTGYPVLVFLVMDPVGVAALADDSPLRIARLPEVWRAKLGKAALFRFWSMKTASSSSGEPTVLIRGNPWKIKDVFAAVSERIQQSWHREIWKASPALIHRKGGVSSPYQGQAFDPEKVDLIPGRWTHDHCVICWWTLYETDNAENGVGFRNDWGEWSCAECYQQFLRDNILNIQ